MSATNRGGDRVEGDFYPTPRWCTKLIAAKINWNKVKSIGEPCAGDNAIIVELPVKETHAREISKGSDYLKNPLPPVDLIITNPPYNLAEEFLKQSLNESGCVVYLLRLNFLGSAKRKKLLTANPPTHLYVHSERPSFVDVCVTCKVKYQKSAKLKTCPGCGDNVKSGTDATEYAWFVWDHVGIMLEAPGVRVF